MRELGELAAGRFRVGELERAKESLEGRLLLAQESTSNRMTRLGNALIAGLELMSLSQTMGKIKAVTQEDVVALASELFDPSRLSAVAIGPREARFKRACARVGPMKVAVYGAEGKVGAILVPALLAAGHEPVDARSGAPTGCEVAVDFTRPEAVVDNVRSSLAARRPMVIGTTGFELAEVDGLARDAGVPCFYAPNFAIGAVLMMRFAAEASRHLPRAEIVELHADTKLDAPSGTARATAEGMDGDVPIHSVRLPGLVAHQEVILSGSGELLTIRHDTTSREAFVPGILRAVEAVASLPPGLTVGLDAIL